MHALVARTNIDVFIVFRWVHAWRRPSCALLSPRSHEPRVTVGGPPALRACHDPLTATHPSPRHPCRGMDSVRDWRFMDSETEPDFDAAYYGKAVAEYAATRAPNATRSGSQPDPEAWWILTGYAKSYEAIRGPVVAVLKEWQAAVRLGCDCRLASPARGRGAASLPRVPRGCTCATKRHAFVAAR